MITGILARRDRSSGRAGRGSGRHLQQLGAGAGAEAHGLQQVSQQGFLQPIRFENSRVSQPPDSQQALGQQSVGQQAGVQAAGGQAGGQAGAGQHSTVTGTLRQRVTGTSWQTLTATRLHTVVGTHSVTV